MDVPLADPTVKKTIEYVDAHVDDVAEAHGSATLMLLLGALSAKARGKEAWDAFRGAFFRRIVSRQDADGAFACIATDALPGTSNDSKPMGGRKIPILQQGADAYVTAIHTWILLLDATQPRTFEPTPGRRPSRTSTPR